MDEFAYSISIVDRERNAALFCALFGDYYSRF
jgi:hypothetical protein